MILGTMSKTRIPQITKSDLTDPPVPRMALQHKGAGAFTGGAAPLPPPTAPGVLPPEDSRLWLFVPKAIQRGEEFIQDDTREWFEARDRKVPISREYIDHPRWLTGKLAETLRGKVYNGTIVSEVHMLARLNAGLAEYPPWVPVRLTVRQVQADTAYRLTKLTRQVLLDKGRQAMLDFAERAPGQFIKFVGSTFIPKRIETETQATVNMDPETADSLIEALSAELKRREEDAKLVTIQSGTDYVEVSPAEGLESAAAELHEASGVGQTLPLGSKPKGGPNERPGSRVITSSLGHAPVPGIEPAIHDIINTGDDDEADHEWD